MGVWGRSPHIKNDVILRRLRTRPQDDIVLLEGAAAKGGNLRNIIAESLFWYNNLFGQIGIF